jgi:hypothetical protein
MKQLKVTKGSALRTNTLLQTDIGNLPKHHSMQLLNPFVLGTLSAGTPP